MMNTMGTNRLDRGEGECQVGVAVNRWVTGASLSGDVLASLGGEGESVWPGREYTCHIRGTTGRPASEQRE